VTNTEILSEVRNRVAFVTLNRPAALNSLSMGMVVGLRAVMRDCALDPEVRAVLLKGAGDKAFCAGGDIRALYESFRSSTTPHRDFFVAEYPLDYFLHFYPKPYIALMDGITMGGGMGLAQGSRMRIVGERTRIAMPEVAIGFFPDVGGSFFLSRAPGQLGLYLALTGAQIRAADALYAGLADVYLARAAVDRLQAQLSELKWSDSSEAWRGDVDRLISGLAMPKAGAPPPAEPGVAPLASVRPAIDEHFAAASVPALLKSLDDERRPEYLDWARQTSATIKTRSPTMLAVTLRQLRLGRTMSFADCLRMEISMTQRLAAQGDFIEGVRAVIVDKDNKPKWRPATLSEVTDASIDAFFEDPWGGTPNPLANLEEDLAREYQQA
jgi:enoyl-CoA hydratase/carnithine racemase